MKIVFDNIAFSNQISGGISVVWQELESRFLKQQDNDITVLEYKEGEKNILHKKIDFTNARIVNKKPIFHLLARYIDPVIRMGEPFIFQSTYYRLCHNRNAINVTLVHDFTYDYFYKGKTIGAFFHIWQRNRAIRESDAVVCISENTKKDLLKFVPEASPDNIFVINNGVSDDYYPIKEKVPGLEEWLLFVGERGAYKNGKFLVEALKDTKYKVLFCGKPFDEEWTKLCDESLGKERYMVKSNISNKELNKIYNSVKCLVYPSSYEGFGIPVLEAQATGCPVIALNASSIPEVIGDKTLLMNELTKEELLDKLKCLEDKELVNSVVEKGKKNASQYKWDSIYLKYNSLYNSLLEKKLLNR